MPTFEEQEVAQILLLIYNAGFWESLDHEIQTKGEALLKQMIDNDVQLEAPKIHEPRMSINEYISMIGSALDLTGLQSEFWVIVIKICYIMMASEKDPLFSQKLKQNSKDDSYLTEILGDDQ